MSKSAKKKEVGGAYEAPAIERQVSSEELDRESLYAGTDPSVGSQVIIPA